MSPAGKKTSLYSPREGRALLSKEQMPSVPIAHRSGHAARLCHCSAEHEASETGSTARNAQPSSSLASRMLPGQNQPPNTLIPELAQRRAGSAQKMPPRSCSKPPWWCCILSREIWKTQEGGLGNTLDCKAEGRQPGLAHCFWPWSIPLSPGNPFHTRRRRPSAAKEQGRAPLGWKPPLPERP